MNDNGSWQFNDGFRLLILRHPTSDGCNNLFVQMDTFSSFCSSGFLFHYSNCLRWQTTDVNVKALCKLSLGVVFKC